jgi:hypothetical protein
MFFVFLLLVLTSDKNEQMPSAKQKDKPKEWKLGE